MKTKKTYTDDHQVRVTAEFDQEVLEQFKRRGARKIAQRTRIPGFRPGKAPYHMVVTHVGEAAIMEEAIDMMLNDVYPKVLEQENIEPYGPGNLENIPSQEPPIFEFVIPLAPEAELAEVESVRKAYEPAAVSDEEVEEFVTQMRQNYANIVPVEGAAKVGQLVYMTVEAQDENAPEGSDPILVKSSPQQTLIPTKKEEKDSEWPFKGFARELIGKKAEDTFSVTHTFPEDDKQGSFAGKTVKFDVNVQSVKELELPAIDEEFLTNMGNFSDEDEFRKAVRDKQESDLIAEYDNNYYLELVDELRKNASLKYPPQMLQDEEDEVLHRIEHDLEHRGLDLDVYLKLRKMDKDQFIEEEVKQTAKDRLERSLVMDAITKKYDIKISKEDLQAEITGVINSLLMSGEYAEAEKQLGKKKFTEAISNEAANSALEKAIRKQLKAIAAPEPVVVEPAEEEAPKEKKPAKKKVSKKKAAETETPAEETETAESPNEDQEEN